jgi:hypothetical protein
LFQGPFAGALKSLKSMISGDNLGMTVPLLNWSLLSEKDIARNMRQSGSTAYVAPDYDYYGSQVCVVVVVVVVVVFLFFFLFVF